MVELFDTYGVLHIGTAVFYFDLENLVLIQSRNWYVDKDGYLTSSYYYLGQLRIVRFHRVVTHAKPGQWVDHKDKNRANNRKQNLRCCNYSQNNRNRGRYSTNTSGVTGVGFDKKRERWVATIMYDHKRMFIGRFQNRDDAILARLETEVRLFGKFAPQWELYVTLMQQNGGV